jgi:hypothetical protein
MTPVIANVEVIARGRIGTRIRSNDSTFRAGRKTPPAKVPTFRSKVLTFMVAVKTVVAAVRIFRSTVINFRSEFLTGGAKVPLIGAKRRTGKAGVYDEKERWAAGGRNVLCRGVLQVIMRLP